MSNAAPLSSHDAGPATGAARGPSGASADPAGRAGFSLAGDGPSIMELFAHGADHDDKRLMLNIVRVLLGAHGFDVSCPVDRLSCRTDVILPRNWRDLPIARAVIDGGAP
jgi:hypothetical protein